MKPWNKIFCSLIALSTSLALISCGGGQAGTPPPQNPPLQNPQTVDYFCRANLSAGWRLGLYLDRERRRICNSFRDSLNGAPAAQHSSAHDTHGPDPR